MREEEHLLNFKKRQGNAIKIFITLATAPVGLAQTFPGPTNFPMVGLSQGQTLQLNLVHHPPQPCGTVKLGFQNSNGVAEGPSETITLAPGHSVSLTYSPVIAFGKRLEVLPTVVANPSVIAKPATPTLAGCVASVEVIRLGVTTVLVPGAVAFSPNPVFGMLGVTSLETVRVNVVAYPPNPSSGTISFVDENGVQIGGSMQFHLNPDQATFFELRGSALRSEVRPLVTLTGGGGIASAEVYETSSGLTTTFYPQSSQLCSLGQTNCVVRLGH
jgi:hypothetical protein